MAGKAGSGKGDGNGRGQRRSAATGAHGKDRRIRRQGRRRTPRRDGSMAPRGGAAMMLEWAERSKAEEA